MKKRILYIILGVLLFSMKGVGQTFTLAANSYSVTSSPINYNCASVTFDCNNNTSNSLVFDVYSSSTGLPGSFSIITSNTVSANNISQLTFYNLGTLYYYAEINSSTIITSSVYQVELRNKPTRPTITSNTPICEGANLTFNTANVSGGTFSWTGVNGFSSSLQNPTITTATTSMTGNYSATVTVNGCTSPSSTISATVNPIPSAPTITSNTPICEGATLTFNATAVSGGTFSWSGVNGFSSSTQNPTISSATTAASGSYSATVTVNGCTSPSSTISATVNPIPSAPTIASNTPICEGATLTFNATAVSGGTFSWTGVNAFSSSLQNPTRTTATTAMTGNYSATVTVLGCTSPSSTISATVNPLPAKPTLTSPVICEGQTATITTPSGTYTYTWVVPTGVSAPGNVNSFTTTKAGTYSLTITDANSCVSEVGTARVTVNPLPPKPTLTSPIICEGATATITGPTGVYTYTWQVPIGVTTSTTNSLTTTKAGTYSLSITDANSCVSEVGTGTVVVNALPPKPTLTSPVICEGATATITGPTGVYTYTWQVPTGVATSTTETISTSKAGTYSLTITDANSCTSEVGTGTVVVNALPPRPTLTSPVICEGETATVTMSTPTGASTYTYTWTVPTGVATSTTKTVSTSKAGTYSLTIMDANSCTSEVGTGTVVVNALPPKPTLTSPVICEGETATVTMLTPTGTSTYIYTWQVPTGVATSTTKTVSTTKAGTYSLTIINDKGCKSADASGTVTVNPIPAVPIISSNSPICEGASLNLVTTNVSGATYSWTGPNNYTSSLINPIINNANSLAAGNYSLKITTNGCSSPLSTPMNVIINATPTAPTVSSNSPIEEEKTLNLTASTLTGASYAWSGPNGFASIQQNPSITGATPANSGKYYATVTLNGCTSVSSLPINVLVNAKVLSSPVFQIPNAFTPNSDGHNDTFKIIENGYVTSIKEFKIFTKSGKLIFSDKDGAWDGRYAGVMLDSDVYIWIADFINKNNIQEHLTGTVLLLK